MKHNTALLPAELGGSFYEVNEGKVEIASSTVPWNTEKEHYDNATSDISTFSVSPASCVRIGLTSCNSFRCLHLPELSGSGDSESDCLSSTPELHSFNGYHSTTQSSNDTTAANTLTSVKSDNPAPGDKTSIALSQIADIGRLMLTMQGFIASGGITPGWSELSAPSLFEGGFHALRSCLPDRLPSTFKEVLALIHLGFAANHINHQMGRLHSRTAFFQSALDWQHAFSDGREAQHFVTILVSLCKR